MTFRKDGWFNATVAAIAFGKEPVQWLRQRETVEYIDALARHLGKPGVLTDINKINTLDTSSSVSRTALLRLSKRTGLVETKNGSSTNGGGTWLHPKLAV